MISCDKLKLQVVFFQLIPALFIECPGFSQSGQTGWVLSNHFGHAIETTEEVGNLEIEVYQQVIVRTRCLPPADGDVIRVLFALDRVGEKATGPKTPQQLIQFSGLGFIGGIDVNFMTLLECLVSESRSHVQALPVIGGLYDIKSNPGHWIICLPGHSDTG